MAGGGGRVERKEGGWKGRRKGRTKEEGWEREERRSEVVGRLIELLLRLGPDKSH